MVFELITGDFLFNPRPGHDHKKNPHVHGDKHSDEGHGHGHGHGHHDDHHHHEEEHGHGHKHAKSELSSDAFDTCNGSIDYDKIAFADDECRRNVILVGTKLDLVRKDPAKREVEFHEAKALARKMRLAAAMEISSKEDTLLGE